MSKLPKLPKLPWSPERIEMLSSLHAQGYSAAHIAGILNHMPGRTLTRNAVIGKLGRLGKGPQKKQRVPKPARPVNKAIPKAPKHADAPYRYRGAEPSLYNVRFIARRADECPRFLDGQDGANGLVCGRPVTHGSWCSDCARALYVVVQERAA